MSKKYEIRKILIPVDFSETALLAVDHACNMAKLFGAEITLLHVIESITFTSAFSNSFTGNDFEMTIERAANKKLSELAAKVQKSSGIPVKIRSEIGRIYVTVVNVASEIGADLIIMGTHGVSGIREFIMGSNAYRVVSEAECPVISLKTAVSKDGFKRILLPIDETIHSREKVVHTAELAQKFGAKVFIYGKPSDKEEATVKKFKMKIEQTENYFRNLNIDCESEIITEAGNYADIVLTHADKVNADLIIIMTEQEFDAMGLILGQAAQQIVNHSKIPVMSIRPDFKGRNVNLHGYGF